MIVVDFFFFFIFLPSSSPLSLSHLTSTFPRFCVRRSHLRDHDGNQTPLHYTHNKQNKTKQGAPLDEADHCGDPPLLLAAGNGHTSVCDLLVNEGADLQQAGLMKECPLARASHNGHYHTVKYLVENGRARPGFNYILLRVAPPPRVYGIAPRVSLLY